MISLQNLHDVWRRVEEKSVHSFQVGPFRISISSNEKSLADSFVRAFDHLSPEISTAHLTIRLWSGAQLPLLDWNQIQTNGYRGYAEPPFYFHYFETIGTLTAIDIEQNIAYYAIRDPKILPWWVNGSPLQTIFHVWMREKGMQLTHCAAVSDRESGLLLAGKGGSGKSTTLLACLQEGLDSLGEDYVLLAPGRAYSVYQTAKWEPHTRTFFPSFESCIANPDTADQEKALVYLKDLFPSQMALSSPIHAIVSLCVGRSASLQKADLGASLQSLLLTTAMQLPHPDPRTALLLRAFAEPMDHYRLSLGPDLTENVSLLKSLFR